MPVYMSSLMNAGKHIYTITLCVCVFMYARVRTCSSSFHSKISTLLDKYGLSMVYLRTGLLDMHTHTHTHTGLLYTYICLPAFINEGMQTGICIDINLCSAVSAGEQVDRNEARLRGGKLWVLYCTHHTVRNC